MNSSLDDGKLRSQCLRGLQKISARCGLLPKSHWIAYSGLSQSDLDSSATERVSDTCKRLMDGQLVAIKTIDPDSIQNPNAFKLVCRSFPQSGHHLIPFPVCVCAEIMYQWDYVETTQTPECGQLPWVRLRLRTVLPCIPLDGQWGPVQVPAGAAECR